MLKMNKHVTKVVAGTLSTSILAHSCIPFSGYDDLLYNFEVQSEEFGKNAIPIRLKFDPNQAAYMGFIQKLSEDIIKYPVIAKQFYNNPDIFLERYGYKGDINLDDDLLKLIIALGDDDINRAVKLGDAGLFIDLCSKKGLLKNTNEMYASLRNQLDKQLTDMGLELPSVEELQAGVAMALLITVLIGFIIVVNITVTWTSTDDVTNPGGGRELTAQNNLKYITEQNPVLYVWFMKQKENKSFVLVDKYTEHQIEGLISQIKERNPVYFEKNSEEDLRNLIKLNTIMGK
jgi:hypothetical protein